MVRESIRQALSEIRGVARGDTLAHLHLRERLVAVAAISVALDAIGSAAMYFLERHADHTDIHNLGDAAFFASVQLLTVSSQMANPLTTGGRLVDLLLEFYAITVVATLAGSFGAFFLHRGREREAQAQLGGGSAT
jgi:hypothetical protein